MSVVKCPFRRIQNSCKFTSCTTANDCGKKALCLLNSATPNFLIVCFVIQYNFTTALLLCSNFDYMIYFNIVVRMIHCMCAALVLPQLVTPTNVFSRNQQLETRYSFVGIGARHHMCIRMNGFSLSLCTKARANFFHV